MSVEAKTVYKIGGGAGTTTRNLGVSVWMPALLWPSADLSRVVEVVVGSLDVEPAAFDTGRLTVQRSIGYFSVSRNYTLTMPKDEELP